MAEGADKKPVERFYRREYEKARYLDPFNGFQEKQILFETRHDEITGATSRIIPGRHRGAVRPDINQYLEKNPESACPFCPALFEKITTKFTPDIHPEGKFRRGNAVLFPNAFPHSAFNCVATFSDTHYLSLTDLSVDVMLDGFLVCLDYFSCMKKVHDGLNFCSINWNYMPPAGGGLVHPHLQTVISENPTNFVRKISAAGENYRKETGGDLWRDLIDYEKAADERYIASTGAVDWMVSFAPRGMLGEVRFIFHGKSSICKVSEDDFRELLSGLRRVFAYFDSKNLISFNAGLFGNIQDDGNLYVQGRIVPRFILLPLGASDNNYFEKIHDETICPVIPEDMCRELKDAFA